MIKLSYRTVITFDKGGRQNEETTNICWFIQYFSSNILLIWIKTNKHSKIKDIHSWINDESMLISPILFPLSNSNTKKYKMEEESKKKRRRRRRSGRKTKQQI